MLLEDRSLKLLNITLDDMGEYTCEAENEVGSIMATGILTVHGKFNEAISVCVSFPAFGVAFAFC